MTQMKTDNTDEEEEKERGAEGKEKRKSLLLPFFSSSVLSVPISVISGSLNLVELTEKTP